jgi:hypothetical protein
MWRIVRWSRKREKWLELAMDTKMCREVRKKDKVMRGKENRERMK